MRPAAFAPPSSRFASPSAAVPLCLPPCALRVSAVLRRPLPPRCWVQKRPPQSSQKLWGGRLFAVASFAFLPCALRVSAGLRRSAVAGLRRSAVAGLRRCAASPSALCPARQRWASPPGSAASVFGSRCRYASSLENSSKEISFLSSVTTSFSAVISLRSAAWLTNWSACSGFFSISSA